MVEWKPIADYEGLYEVSNTGLVRGVERIDSADKRQVSKVLSTTAKNGNYITCVLSKNNIKHTYRIHRLVASAFIPNPENKPCINHVDGNKQNNSVENLEWCTPLENNQHARKNGLNCGLYKLTKEDVSEIKAQKGKDSGTKLADKYGVSFQRIYRIWGCLS